MTPQPPKGPTPSVPPGKAHPGGPKAQGTAAREPLLPEPGLYLYAGSLPRAGADDGQGRAARFNGPMGVVVAPDGTTFVADPGNHTLRKVTPGGRVSTYAGVPGTAGHADGPALKATFDAPSHLALDGQGNLYVTDFNSHTLRMITPAGAVTTVAGLPGQAGCTDGPVATATFDGPSGIVVAGDGIYILDTNSNTLRCLRGGIVSTVAGTAYQVGATDGPGAAARFNYPVGLARDAQGNFYIADNGNMVIRSCTPAFEVSTYAGNGLVGSADGPGATAQFYDPFGVTVDGEGNLYVTDGGNNCLLRKINPARQVTTLAGKPCQQGTADGTGAQARFSSGLGGLALDAKGVLTVVDHGSNTLRRVTPGGRVTTLAGQAAPVGCDNGMRLAASFSFPTTVALDRSGVLYVGDDLNGAIRKITPAGRVSILAGHPGLPGHKDGQGRAAHLRPFAVCRGGRCRLRGRGGS